MARKSVKIDVTINPGDFVDVTSSNPAMFTRATFTLDAASAPPISGVTQPGGANARIEVAEIAKLVFQFSDPYKPVDVMFAQTAGAGDLDGKTNLIGRIRHQKAGGWKLVVLDTLNDGAPGNTVRWKFFIAIQDTNTRRICIIDPEVSNTDQD